MRVSCYMPGAFTDAARCTLQPCALLLRNARSSLGEGCGVVAVDVDLSDDTAANVDGDENFRAVSMEQER